jgi:hypothetical protein
MAGQFGLWFRLPRILRIYFACRKSATWDRQLYFPSEGRRGFFRPKTPTASAGFEPEASMLTTRPPKPLIYGNVCCISYVFYIIFPDVKFARRRCGFSYRRNPKNSAFCSHRVFTCFVWLLNNPSFSTAFAEWSLWWERANLANLDERQP